MDGETVHKKVTAIVPTYNEATRIGRVLDVLTTYPKFLEIIVVDDGSIDNTAQVVAQYNVRYLPQTENHGKGYVMDIGVAQAAGDIIFFADADVTGLTHQVIDEILQPMIEEGVDMSIGTRKRLWFTLNYLLMFIPLLGGERAITKKLWLMLPDYYKHRFRIEVGLNFYALYYGNGFRHKIFKDLAQVLKEKKYGMWSGLKQRWQLVSNVTTAQIKLHLVDIPKSVRTRKLVGWAAVQSIAGMVLGVLFFVAVYYGPKNFVYHIFAEELTEDKSAPIAKTILYFVSVTSINALLAIGALLFIVSLIALALTAKRLPYLFNGYTYKINTLR